MSLPINIKELVHGQTIEWERLEFKRSWNPEDIVHSMCAFANDLNNWGGGYIIVGVTEDKGKPVLPPHGVPQNQLDAIQGEIVQLAHRISPNYFPITEPYLLDDKHILVLWCPAGDNRPYTAPSTMGGAAQRQSYVRIGSRSIVAQGENARRLQELAARIPFDDRINNRATINDLDLGLIQAYLQEVKSSLFAQSTQMEFAELCRTMQIAKGPQEDIRPANVGLLFFSQQPEHFFDRAWIELVWHKDISGRKFDEIYFKGPLHKQLRDALSFIKTNILREKVIKRSDRPEADRFYNYPIEALEESLANAVYHKSYELGSPIEVQVFYDKITILSHPGPVPPVNAQILANDRHIIAREYRNRRIGDFLKELHLTEGRGTGFPTIYEAMANNGSPNPIFETDDAHYVLVTLPVHPMANNDHASNGASDGVKYNVFNTLEEIIAFCDGASDGASDQVQNILNEAVHERIAEILDYTPQWINRGELFHHMGLSNHSTNRKKYLDPMLEIGWIELEYPDRPTHPKQRYRITPSGQRLKNLLIG